MRLLVYGICILAATSCSKNVAKETLESTLSPASRDQGGQTTTSVLAVRQCASPITGLSGADLETAVASFFYKTVVPAGERAWSRADLEAKYWSDGKVRALMNLQGNVSYCLTPSGVGASRAFALRIEYEDAFGLSSIDIPAGNTYSVDESNPASINIIWMDRAGFVQLKGLKSGATIRFANMPSTSDLEARPSAVPPIAYTFTQRSLNRNSATLDEAISNFVYSPEMFVDASTWNTYPFNIGSYPSEGNFGPAQISRLKDMIERYVDSENLSVSTHPFNTNYSGFLIRNGKLGNVSVSY